MTDKENAEEAARILGIADALIEASWRAWIGESVVDFLVGLGLICGVVGLLYLWIGV